MKVYIYSLSDPRSGEICYVGKSTNPRTRLYQHVSDLRGGGKSAWIQELRSLHLRPVLDILEESIIEEWEQSERWWIAYLKFIGCPLLNLDRGGVGGRKRKKLSPERKEKLRLAHVGLKHPPRSEQWISKQRLAQGGRNPEERAKLAGLLRDRITQFGYGSLTGIAVEIGAKPTSVFGWINGVRLPHERFVDKIKAVLSK